jgi:peptide/nickel transport system substrate-binding protein
MSSKTPRATCWPRCPRTANLKFFEVNPLGNQYVFRFNTLHKPFDNPKIRQALFYAFNQEDFLKAVHGDAKYYQVCKALFICDTPLASTVGMSDKLESNMKKAREMLAEAKYDGTPGDAAALD